jgi:hypothetical protein
MQGGAVCVVSLTAGTQPARGVNHVHLGLLNAALACCPATSPCAGTAYRKVWVETSAEGLRVYLSSDHANGGIASSFSGGKRQCTSLVMCICRGGVDNATAAKRTCGSACRRLIPAAEKAQVSRLRRDRRGTGRVHKPSTRRRPCGSTRRLRVPFQVLSHDAAYQMVW